jgi:Rieske 2Fe-2S family protein
MKNIATMMDDSRELMAAKIAAQREKPGFAMDSYFYRSHLVYQRELDELIYRSWLYAGHVSQVVAPGDYFLYEIAEDSIIVSRAEDGEVHAFSNSCRHRGARVCEEASGSRKTLVCPYHGWVYNMDGSLKAARWMERLDGFDPVDYGLKQVRVAVFEGLIFINCDPDAAPFEPDLEKLRSTLSPYDLPNAKLAHAQVYTVDANWKLALENYLECYHCATAHRSYAKLHTLQDLDDRVGDINDAMRTRSEEQTGVEDISFATYAAYCEAPNSGNCVYTSRYALYDGYVTGSRDGQPVAPLMGSFKGYDGGAGDFQIGPLAFMLNYPDHCVLYRFTPRGITETDMEIVWFVRGDAQEGVDYDKDAVTWLWHHTTLEDEYIIRRNSEGVNSRFFQPGPYHPEFERCCLDFVTWYLDTMGRQGRGPASRIPSP